jgi:hypothetical protein
MIANDVAPPDGGEADGRRVALAGNAFATVNRAFLEIAAKCAGDHFAHAQRRTGRGIDLQAMMRLNDFNVVTLVQDARRRIEQLEGEIDADGHVGGKNDGYVLGRSSNRSLAIGLETGRTDNDGNASLTTQFEMNQRPLRTGEVNQAVDIL